MCLKFLFSRCNLASITPPGPMLFLTSGRHHSLLSFSKIILFRFHSGENTQPFISCATFISLSTAVSSSYYLAANHWLLPLFLLNPCPLFILQSLTLVLHCSLSCSIVSSANYGQNRADISSAFFEYNPSRYNYRSYSSPSCILSSKNFQGTMTTFHNTQKIYSTNWISCIRTFEPGLRFCSTSPIFPLSWKISISLVVIRT